MMDQFLEQVVTKRNQTMQTVAYIFAWISLILMGFMAFLQFTSITAVLSQYGFGVEFFITLAQLVIFGGLAVFIYIYKDRIKMEYEYTFTNGQLDFAQVFNNKKRKNLGTMNLKNLEACGLVSSGSFNRYINMQGIKRTNWFLNREAELLYFYYQKNGEKHIIIIEPNEEMLAMIKRSLPQGVWQNN